MARSETIIRVTHDRAAWFNELRDRYGFASVAVVADLFYQRFGLQFEESLHEPVIARQADDRTA